MTETINVWARELVRDLERRKIDTAGLLAASRLARARIDAEDVWIPHHKHCELFEAAAVATGDPLYGARLGREIDVRLAGLIAYSGLSAEQLGDAIRNFARYLRLIDKAEPMSVCIADQTWSVVTQPLFIHAPQATMFGDSLLSSTCRRLTGCDIVPKLISFPHARPPTGAADVEAFFACPIHFSGPRCIDFAAEDMALPVTTADRHLAKLVRRCGDEMLRQSSQAASSIVSEIAAAVMKQLPGGLITTAALAQTLGLSERTLRRRAANAGTTVGEVVARTRAELAEQYIRSDQFLIKEIAYLCGYMSVSGFSAARRRWKRQ